MVTRFSGVVSDTTVGRVVVEVLRDKTFRNLDLSLDKDLGLVGLTGVEVVVFLELEGENRDLLRNKDVFLLEGRDVVDWDMVGSASVVWVSVLVVGGLEKVLLLLASLDNSEARDPGGLTLVGLIVCAGVVSFGFCSLVCRPPFNN